MNLTHRDPFNFTVGDIKFTILRDADPLWRMDKTTPRKHHILAIACSGRATYETDEGRFPVKKGDVLFFRKGEARSAYSSLEDPWSFISVAFDLIPLGKNPPEDLFPIPTLTAAPHHAEYHSLFSELLTHWNLRDEGSLLKCRALICQILEALLRDARENLPSHAQNDGITLVKQFLAEHYAEPLHTEALAAMAKLSPSHFRALFKQQTGEAPLQFQNRLRIAKACDLLRSGSCNVSEAADATGFSDVYYFSRLFKKITGHPPSKYRQQGT